MFANEIEILKNLQGLRTGILNKIFEFITIIGEEIPMVLIIIIIYFAFDKKFAQKLCYISVTSLSINGIIKNFVKLPRPFVAGDVTCVRPETATGYSFPSAHTHNFATWSTVLALKLKKFWAAILVGALIILVGFSRMFLGAHYPSDVIVGAILGVLLAIIGSKIYDKVQNKSKLYLATILILTPFAILFLFNANPLYEDLYKFYGMIIGLALGIMFEEKFAPLEYDVTWWKKAIRVVIGIIFAYVIKEICDILNIFQVVQISLLFEIISYFVLVFIICGICPLIFKKCRI